MNDSVQVIFETRTGSRAYGLHGPGSDEDFRGVVVGPRSWYFGYLDAPEQLAVSGDDHVRTELRKFIRLAAQANPTVIEMLWTDPEDHQTVTAAGRRLLAQREMFLSRRARGSFGAYALGQLKRLRSHRAWLLDPPKKKPTRRDYGLPEQTVVPKDQLGAAESLLGAGEFEAADVSANFIELLRREKSYKSAARHYQQYEAWKKSRNPQRAELEAKFGYDTKHAMHLVRLQRMGLEILRDGQVNVRRADREELLAIKCGGWSYDELMAQCDDLSRAIEAADRVCTLPPECDTDAAQDLCVSIMEEVLS